MIIAWSTIIKPIQFTNALLINKGDSLQNSNSVEYIAAAASVRVSKNLGIIPFDLKTRSQDFINQIRVELGYPSENAGFCSGRTELFPEKTRTYPILQSC